MMGNRTAVNLMIFLLSFLIFGWAVLWVDRAFAAGPSDISFEWEMYTITAPGADATWIMKLYENGVVIKEVPATVNEATVPYLDNNQPNDYWLTGNTPDGIESGPSTVVTISALPPPPVGMKYKILFNGEETGLTVVPDTQ